MFAHSNSDNMVEYGCTLKQYNGLNVELMTINVLTYEYS